MLNSNTPRRMFSSSRLLPALALSVLCASVACKQKAIRGGEGTDNPNLDNAAMSTGLDRVDLQHLMKKNMGKLVSAPIWAKWRGAAEQPIVAIWPIKNDTSEHLDDQMATLLSDVESELVNSGVVAVVSRERQAELIRETNIQNTADFNPAMAAQLGQQLGAQYFITGKLQAVDERMNKERRVQYSLFMQVLEVETGIVRFQNKSERTKAIIR